MEKFMAYFLNLKTVFRYRDHVFKNDLNFTILINVQTMLKSKSRIHLSNNPETGGGRLRSAPKRKAAPAQNRPLVYSLV